MSVRPCKNSYTLLPKVDIPGVKSHYGENALHKKQTKQRGELLYRVFSF